MITEKEISEMNSNELVENSTLYYDNKEFHDQNLKIWEFNEPMSGFWLESNSSPYFFENMDEVNNFISQCER